MCPSASKAEMVLADRKRKGIFSPITEKSLSRLMDLI